MTDYERGYTDGYKDGLHKFIPEVASIPIPQIATERQARIEALEQARDNIAAELVHEPYGRDIAFRNNGLKRAMSIIDEAISAERERFADAAEAIEGDARAVFDCLRYHASAGGEYEYRGTLAIEAFQRVVDKIPRAESAKPEPGDVVAFVTEGVDMEPTMWRNGMGTVDPLGKTRVVVLMRAAEVKRRIEEGK